MFDGKVSSNIYFRSALMSLLRQISMMSFIRLVLSADLKTIYKKIFASGFLFSLRNIVFSPFLLDLHHFFFTSLTG